MPILPAYGRVTQASYTPYGELRWPGVSQSPTDFGYTGQRADSFGLMDYNARFYSPHLGRFVSADSVVPNPGKAVDFDRFAYSSNNPIRYRDPSGHGYCNSQYALQDVCDELDPDGDGYTDPFHVDPDDYKDAAETEYKDALDRGIVFVNQLLGHEGWWTTYLNDPAMAWKFLFVLAFLFESYSYSNMPDWDDFKSHMTDSTINKAGDLYREYGTAGLFIYLGGREGLFDARGSYGDNDPHWQEGTPEYLNTWDFDYLGISDLYKESWEAMDDAWPLVLSHDGTPYGSGAYDYGVSPPLIVDESKIVWRSETITGLNPWTRQVEDYFDYFVSK